MSSTPLASAAAPAFAPDVPGPIRRFLAVPTPAAWLAAVPAQVDRLLLDHANCEKKAASSALAMLYRYPDRPDLVYRMSRLAREELRHFEQVGAIIAARGIAWAHVPASRYAARLRAEVDADEPGRLRDTLICGAFIEARSCERFAALAPLLDAPLAKFYRGLLSAEARHFEQYLALARAAHGSGLDTRIGQFRDLEARLIVTRDEHFSFHSGPPVRRPA
jgi:tRNA-(ms[2]io[6]A)-hydroxylase